MKMDAMKKKAPVFLQGCLWFFASAFAVFSPLRGAVNQIFPKMSSAALGMGAAFAGLFFIFLLVKKRFVSAVKQQKVFSIFCVVLFAITAYKFIADFVSGASGEAFSFFAYFAIPLYVFFAWALSVWIAENHERIYPLLQFYALSFSVTFLLYSDRYLMDIGGAVRAVGNYSNPNEMGTYAVLSLCCTAVLLARRQYFFLVNLLLAACSAAAVFLTESRTAIMALAIAALILFGLFCFNRNRKDARFLKQPKRRLLGAGAACIGVFAVLSGGFVWALQPNLLTVTDIRGEAYTIEARRELAALYPELREEYEKRYALSQIPEDVVPETPSTEPSDTPNPGEDTPYNKAPSANVVERFLSRLFFGNHTESSAVVGNLRFTIWARYLTKIDRYWLIGAENGFASIRPLIDKTTRDCHNTFLYFLVQYGCVPFVLFLALFVFFIRKYIFTRTLALSALPLSGIVAILIVFCMFNDLVHVPAAWLLLAVLYGADPHKALSKNKIAIVRRYSGYGGIERQIRNLCGGLNRQGYEVFLLTDRESPMTEACSAAGAAVHLMPMAHVFSTGNRVAAFCAKNEIGIVQTHMFYESFAGRTARFLCGELCHVFRVHTYIDCSQISKRKKDVYHLVSRLSDPFVDRYISINEYNVTEMRNRTHLPERKIATVHDGVAALGEPFDFGMMPEKRLVMIANFVPFKGHDILIQGLRLLKEKGVILPAYLYGACPCGADDKEDKTVLTELQTMAKEQGVEEQIHFCGPTADVRQALMDKWALVLPSYAEGTPNCVLEAMSLKTLTIASDVGGVSEFLKDGVNGFLHKPGSPEAFAEAVLRALQLTPEQEKQIEEAAWKTWNGHFLPEQSVRGLMVQYSHL